MARQSVDINKALNVERITKTENRVQGILSEVEEVVDGVGVGVISVSAKVTFCWYRDYS